MKRKVTCLATLSAVIMIAALYYAGSVWATPANGFTATTLVKGTFGDIDVFNKFITPNSSGDDDHANVWLSLQKTKGSSDLYVQSNTWQPGGSTGWHSHPGHSLITVTAGTLTEYHGDDPECKPTVYTAGMTFVDPGGSHVHIIRNEGNVVATNIAVQLIPAGQPRRIDVAAPGNCPF
jgi:quercetin dioxygenase-like cupin family protein